jgi:hypothetical protein
MSRDENPKHEAGVGQIQLPAYIFSYRVRVVHSIVQNAGLSQQTVLLARKKSHMSFYGRFIKVYRISLNCCVLCDTALFMNLTLE